MNKIKTKQNIPSGWGQEALSDLVLIKKGEQLNKLAMDDSGKYPALNGGISHSGYTDKWNTEANTITISEGGNSCGYVNFNKERFWCGGHCYALLEVGENIDNDFLYQALKSKQDALMKLRVGSGLPNIQKRSIEEFSLLVPESKKEQQKIAEILGTVDEDIAKTQEAIEATEKLKRGLMQELFTRGIGHTKFKKIKLGEIPEEWDVVKGSGISELISKGASPRWQGFEYQNDGMIFVTSENVRNGYLDLSITKFLPLEFYHKLKNSQLKQGDILINIVGASIARSCLYDGHYQYANINQAVCLMRVKDSVSQQYILQYLQSPEVISRLLVSQGGSARANLSLTDIRNFDFILPKREEQQKIAEILSAVDEKISVNKKLKAKLTLLKKGLMQDLLNGRVRTLQNFTVEMLQKYIEDIFKLENKNTHIDNNGTLKMMKDSYFEMGGKEKIKQMLEDACEITKVDIDSLIRNLDFKPNNLTIEAVEAFLSELRSIFWLRDFGFTDIQPLRAKRNSTQLDFIAKYKNNECAIEVFCLTSVHGQQRDSAFGVYTNVDPQFNGSKFGRDFMSKATDKKKQLDSSDAKVKILLCIVNSQPVISLNTAKEMNVHAKFLYDNLAWGRGYFVGILTGANVNGMSSDTIYPKLDV